MEQTQWLAEDPTIVEQLKLKPNTDETSRHPIFRIDMNFLDLFYLHTDTQYQIHSELLSHTKIRPQDRQVNVQTKQKLKSWLLSETHNSYQRETYATASRFLDMYFSKRQKVSRNAFQVLGIACLILASKIVQRRVPNISFQVFDKDQIFNFERQLLKIFNYKLSPVTYVAMTDLLFYFWDNYECEINAFREVKYFKEELKSIKRARVVFETLDCMDLGSYYLIVVPETLDISLENLVICVFSLQNRKFCLEAFKNCHEYSLTQTDDHHFFSDLYQRFMLQFYKCLSTSVPAFSSCQILTKTLLYTMRFSRINPKIVLPTKYKNFRFQIGRQTFNPEITLIAQNFINRK